MPKMGGKRTVDATRFAMVPKVGIPRSAFDVVHCHKTTFEAGELIPIYVDEVLPGDSHRLKMTALARLAVPLVPIMDNVVLESHFFFVPCRLVWEHWERFMGEQDSPSDSTVFLLPQIPLATGNLVPGTLGDYFGITVNNIAASTISVNSLPFRAYNLIWNDWFRDEDVQAKVVVDVDDGPDDPADYLVLPRNKQRDYFTSARPFPQKMYNIEDSGLTGGPLQPGGRMVLGLSAYGAGAPVTGLGVAVAEPPSGGSVAVAMTGSRAVTYPSTYSSTAETFYMQAQAGGGTYPDVRVLVNDMRMAEMVQVYLERLSRGGSRYAELVRTIFGVVSPDARLQRPEYLGGGRSYVNISPIAQTAPPSDDVGSTVLAEQAATGHVVAHAHGFSQSFTEHGYIIGLISARPDLTYQNGTHRMWWRRTQFDFYSPPFAHLGEQVVMQGEIYSAGVTADRTTVFGYQERWSEYKYMPSRVSGALRSSTAAPLDMWHLAENFASAPTLNNAFITVDEEGLDRALQTDTLENQQFVIDALFDVRKVRCMPMFSIPGVSARM